MKSTKRATESSATGICVLPPLALLPRAESFNPLASATTATILWTTASDSVTGIVLTTTPIGLMLQGEQGEFSHEAKVRTQPLPNLRIAERQRAA